MHKGLIAGILCSTALLSGQSQPADPDKRGSLSGVTIDGKSGEPVRRVLMIVRLIPSAEAAATVARAQSGGIGTTSDAAGRFIFQDLEPGTYAVTAARDGYVAARESLRPIIAVRPAKQPMS